MDPVRATLAAMLSSGDFSDPALSCRGREFKVHKAVVCTHSAVIKAALTNGFKYTFDEMRVPGKLTGTARNPIGSHTNVYDVEGFDAETVWRMVEFMYLGTYSEPSTSTKDAGTGDDVEDGADEARDGNGCDDETPDYATRMVMDHIRVNSIGNYFAIDALAALANDNVKKTLGAWAAAESGAVTGRENKFVPASSLADALPGIIELAVTNTGDKRVLDIVASATVAKIDDVVTDEGFKQLDVVPAFSLMVLQHCNAEIQKSKTTISDHRAEIVCREYNHRTDKLTWSEEQTRLSGDITRMKHLINIVNTATACRSTSCSAVFGCYVYLEENLVRCRQCHCKHVLTWFPAVS